MFRKQTQTSEKQSTRCIAENSVARLKMHLAEQIRQMWQKYAATRWYRDAAMNSTMLPPQRATAMKGIALRRLSNTRATMFD